MAILSLCAMAAGISGHFSICAQLTKFIPLMKKLFAYKFVAFKHLTVMKLIKRLGGPTSEAELVPKYFRLKVEKFRLSRFKQFRHFQDILIKSYLERSVYTSICYI